LGADHGAVKAGIERLVQHPGGMPAALHRHGRERDQRRQRLHTRQQMLVVEAAPIGALVGRKLVAEAVEPAAHHLAADILPGHPGAALLDVAQRRHDRPGHFGAGKGKAQLAVLLPGLERGEQALLRLDVGKQRRRNEMGVGIDDQVVHSWKNNVRMIRSKKSARFRESGSGAGGQGMRWACAGTPSCHVIPAWSRAS
jgi:hypothetical protein